MEADFKIKDGVIFGGGIDLLGSQKHVGGTLWLNKNNIFVNAKIGRTGWGEWFGQVGAGLGSLKLFSWLRQAYE